MMTTSDVVVTVLSVLVFTPAPSSARTLTFEDDRCGGAYTPTPRESLNVIHTGDIRSYICKDMSFSGWDDVDEVSREVCVKVTDFQLDCTQTLEYRAGSNRGNPTKSYGCKESWDTIPKFCTFDILYIRIKLEEPLENTKVEYLVLSGAEKEREDAYDSSTFSTIIAVVIAMIVVITTATFALVFCIRRKRGYRGQQGTVVYNPTQSPQVNVSHYYHPVNQNQDHVQTYPTQGYNAPPQQTQGYNAPPQQTQGYNAPPQQTQGYNAPPQQTQGSNAPPQPNQGYNAPPQQTQGYNTSPQQTHVYNAPSQLNQVYNAPSQGNSGLPQQTQGYNTSPQQTQGYSGPPNQLQTPPLPSAPVAYPYPQGQEFSPPCASAPQQTNDADEPPSYEEVTKRKL